MESIFRARTMRPLLRLLYASPIPSASFQRTGSATLQILSNKMRSFMQIRFIALSAAIAVLVCAAPAFSHHSNSAYVVDQVMTLTGVVTEWKWSNPHTWLYMTVDDGKG